MPARIAVLVSGGGTNLQALLDHFNERESAVARVALVVGSRGGIGALTRAEQARVPTAVLDPAADLHAGKLQDALERAAVDLIVLAGYLRMIPAAVVARFRGRILNIHPALLPAFGGAGMYGLRVHRAVIESGARVSGATVHLVDERYDEGRIIAQWPVPVLPGDTSEMLAARILPVEHALLPAAVEMLLGGWSAEDGAAADPLAFDIIRSPVPARVSLGILAPLSSKLL
ncbi:MAG TPA: phosphoribosylglycinamide formyltransferase [Longimicrobiaceae bacterium]|nr:phosphoribosylglycinamide formyltransferase [Longimicrobiaceae bacterium]